ncbi:hypothetical protein AAC387_Pa10g1722 [Persea americana]
MATLYNFLLFSSLCLISIATISESARQFQVGGPAGWTQPTGKENETYNQWAAKHRFHVGDSLYFKYMNDSVLVVDEDDYNRCGSSKPIAKYEDGKTVIELDRYGFFFFISGVGGHCKSGQKLIVWVMAHHPISQVPAPAPSAGGGGSGSGSGSGSGEPPSSSSSSSSSPIKVTIAAASFAPVLGVMMVISFFL